MICLSYSHTVLLIPSVVDPELVGLPQRFKVQVWASKLGPAPLVLPCVGFEVWNPAAIN